MKVLQWCRANAMPVIAVLAPIGLWVGLAQRLAFALWFGWWLLAAWRFSRT